MDTIISELEVLQAEELSYINGGKSLAYEIGYGIGQAVGWTAGIFVGIYLSRYIK